MNSVFRVSITLLLLGALGCHAPATSIKLNKKIFERGRSRGKVDKTLKEASGMVASYQNPKKLWVLNDGGNKSEIYLINERAQIEMSCSLKGVDNIDWEEISIEKDELGMPYLLIGDIGDNLGTHQTKSIYKIKEPLQDQEYKEIDKYDVLTVKLSDGSRDTETMFVDPVSHNLFLISKREDAVGVYEVSYPFEKDTLMAQKKITIPFRMVTAATISDKGMEFIMKDYGNIYYWKRMDGQSISEMLQNPPVRVPYKLEVQGESLCFAADGTGFYTLSESHFMARARLIFYRRKR